MLARIYRPAKNAMQSGKAATKKWRLEFELARAPKPEERERLAQYLNEQATIYEKDPGAAATLTASGGKNTPNETIDPAAWTALCSVILNLDEFITRE